MNEEPSERFNTGLLVDMVDEGVLCVASRAELLRDEIAVPSSPR